MADAKQTGVFLPQKKYCYQINTITAAKAHLLVKYCWKMKFRIANTRAASYGYSRYQTYELLNKILGLNRAVVALGLSQSDPVKSCSDLEN